MNLFMPSSHSIMIPSGSGTAPWTPASLPDLYQWFDAQDAASITKDGNNYITNWNDKSGNSGHLSVTGTNGPIYGATSFGGKPGFTFGTSSYLLNDTNHGKDFLRNQDGITIIFVSVPQSNSYGNTYLYYSNGNSSSYVRLKYWDYGSGGMTVNGSRTSDSDSRIDIVSHYLLPKPQSDAYITRIQMNYASHLANLFFSNQGDTTDVMNTAINSASSVSDTRSLYCTLGGGAQNTGANFVLGELIMVRDVLTSDEISNLNTYLRARWGIS